MIHFQVPECHYVVDHYHRTQFKRSECKTGLAPVLMQMHPLKSMLHTFPSSGSYTVVICTLFPVHVERNPVYYTLHLSLTSKQKHDIPVTHPTPYLLHVDVVQLQPEISNGGTVGLEGLV